MNRLSGLYSTYLDYLFDLHVCRVLRSWWIVSAIFVPSIEFWSLDILPFRLFHNLFKDTASRSSQLLSAHLSHRSAIYIPRDEIWTIIRQPIMVLFVLIYYLQVKTDVTFWLGTHAWFLSNPRRGQWNQFTSLKLTWTLVLRTLYTNAIATIMTRILLRKISSPRDYLGVVMDLKLPFYTMDP